MIEKQVVVAGQLVNYLTNDLQDPAAPTVVFLHGWGASGKIWQGIMEKLEKIYCYALDLPGFGKSELPKKAFTVADYAELVREFIGKLGLKNVALVGHSFGGRVAIKSTIAHNVAIQRLVLVAAAGFRDNSALRSTKIALAKIAKPFVPASMRKNLAKMFGAGDYAESGEMKQTFLNIINEDLTEGIKNISVPTLIIWGENDKETPVEFGARMHSYIPNSTFSILPGAGHYSFLDKPEGFTRVLQDFIEE
ncbi:MAG: hypothetical protein A2846_02440 [Candidatus Doudnabacteria bacterium RIFCSPHIGHO2_01_FULL_49_9]|uniref:AB hydrolase-1 domain-containing protein n=1 Tax=Candidatus Doudnabacteria bacterium RIFCSPHIGHO2_01_FULL_49_9 TaxID=1817827 RepID=A0A1F5P291_9BACT|nr:MAG: hypothetical protein A2846_02440 [Candidatus Doudnabacteria bacterium RIFCSPHIGHO2_01_FULL_49_9]